MTRKKKIIRIIAVIAIVALVIKGKGLLESRKAEISNAEFPLAGAITVPVIHAQEGLMQNRVAFLAQIISDKSIKLSTKLSGYVEKVLVEEAQKVKKGEVLVRIDTLELNSNIAAVKATLNAQKQDMALAKSIYARNKKLYAVGGLSKEQLDISQVALKSKSSIMENSKEKIAQLNHQFSYLQIVAPFDGEIDAIFLHEGDLAASGKAILSMSNGEQKLLFSYAPSQKTLIKKEQDVLMNNIEIGYVKSIYTMTKNGLVFAEVTLNKNLPLPTGSSVNIEVLTKEKKGCMIPKGTVLHEKEGTFVMVYTEDSFSPLKIDVQMQNSDQLLISPCPKDPIAQMSEAKLAQLPAYDRVNISGIEK
jgi:membrane fusion protein (multidrug efflux system)